MKIVIIASPNYITHSRTTIRPITQAPIFCLLCSFCTSGSISFKLEQKLRALGRKKSFRLSSAKHLLAAATQSRGAVPEV